MYVEAKLANNPFYKPACETSWGSCSTVFKSEYAHILSHWGLVPKGHPLDLSLAAAGIIVYSVYLLYPTRLFGVFPKPHMVLLALSIGGQHARCLCAHFEVRGFMCWQAASSRRICSTCSSSSSTTSASSAPPSTSPISRCLWS